MPFAFTRLSNIPPRPSRLSATLRIAACAIALLSAPGIAQGATPEANLVNIVALAARRLALAVPVAEWKWHNHKAIEDKPREQELLNVLLKQASAARLDPDAVRPFMVDQITASKQVQKALFADYATTPPAAPAADTLEKTRVTLNTLSAKMIVALAHTRQQRAAADCPTRLKEALESWRSIELSDGLQMKALDTALGHVCERGGIGASA